MTEKWISLTPNPPRIPVFYTFTKIHKPNPVGRPIISSCDSPTERISSFVYLSAKVQESYLKDTTDFLNLKEKTKVVKETMLVSMDVTSLYTNIPQKEGINLVCKTGADPGFFLGGGAPLRNDVTNTNKPHFFAEYQLY